MQKSLFVFCTTLILSTTINAQNPSMIKEINPTSGSSPSAFSITSTNKIRFYADDGTHGRELWETDGTSNGTFMIKDLDPGTDDGCSVPKATLGAITYYTGGDNNSRGLWKTDGTSAGTSLVKSTSISGGTQISSFTEFNNMLYFRLYTGNGFEFWKSDGTSSGTSLINTARPRTFGVSNNTLFFTELYNDELWKTDGTDAGTVLLKSFDELDYYNNVEFTTIGGTTYFVGKDATNGYELWKTDGTPTGTVLVKDIKPGYQGSYPSGLTNVNGTLFFVAYDDFDGSELWKTDGTAAGTVLVKDINVGANDGVASNFYGSSSQSHSSVVFNNTFYFTANDGTNDLQVWKSDGTAAGTTMVTSITWPYSFPNADLFVAGNKLYFIASGLGLYESDGTASGTSLVIPNSIVYIGARIYMNGKLYFSGSNQWSSGSELWVYDPASTTININKVKNQKPFAELFPNPTNGLLTITLEKDKEVNLSVLDATGKTVLEETITTTTSVNTEKLSNGVYFMRLMAMDQTQIIRFVKN